MANEQHNVAFKTILTTIYLGLCNFSPETDHMLPAILHRMHQAKEQETLQSRFGAMVQPSRSFCML